MLSVVPQVSATLNAPERSRLSSKQKNALLLYTICDEALRIYYARWLTQPATTANARATRNEPTDEYKATVAILKQEFATSTKVIVKWKKFHNRYQEPGKTIPAYLTVLRDLAKM